MSEIRFARMVAAALIERGCNPDNITTQKLLFDKRDLIESRQQVPQVPRASDLLPRQKCFALTFLSCFHVRYRIRQSIRDEKMVVITARRKASAEGC